MNSTGKKSPRATRGISQPSNRQARHAPQFKPVVAQLKTPVSAQSVKRPVAPPVYRPQAQPLAVQRKAAQLPQPKMPPASPHVYRPQPVPKCLQLKTTRQSLANESKSLPPRPSVHPPQQVHPTAQLKRSHQSTATKIGKQQPQVNTSRNRVWPTTPSLVLQRHTAKKLDVKPAAPSKRSAEGNTIQRYLLINTGRSKFHFSHRFPPDESDLRVGSRDTFDKLNTTGQMKHVLGVFKEWGKEQYGFVEFKSWEDAVAKALVTPPAEEPEDEVKKKPGLKWKSNSDKAWQHTFKKHGAKEKKRLVQIAKNTDKGKQGMWVNNEEAANYLKSIRHLIGGGPANIPIPAGMGIEIKPDGKEEPVDRAIVVPSGHSGGYTTAYPTSDYIIKAGKVIFWFGDPSGSIGLSLEEEEEEEEEE